MPQRRRRRARPSPDALRARTPQAVIESLVNGAMRVQGARLSGAERRAVAEYVTGKTSAATSRGGERAGARRRRASNAATRRRAWSGWSPTVTNTRFQPARSGRSDRRDLPRLTLKWAFGFPDASVGLGAADRGGRTRVRRQPERHGVLARREDRLHPLDVQRGGRRAHGDRGRTCAMAARRRVYFGDTAANAYALDAETGQRLWTRKVDDHPLARITGSPTLHEGRLYVPVSSYEEAQGADPQYACCTFRGSVVGARCDVRQRDLEDLHDCRPAAAPRHEHGRACRCGDRRDRAIWSAPTVDAGAAALRRDRQRYSGPPQPSSDAVVALDLETGSDRDGCSRSRRTTST